MELFSWEEGDDNHITYIVDQAGNIFATSEGRKGREDEQKPANQILSNFDQLRQIDVTTTTIVDRILAAYVPLESVGQARQDLPDLGWTVIRTVPNGIAFRPQRELLTTLTGGTFLATLLLAWVVTQLVNRSVRPIEQAADTVSKIGQGNLDVRLPFSGEDEIAQLGTNINYQSDGAATARTARGTGHLCRTSSILSGNCRIGGRNSCPFARFI